MKKVSLILTIVSLSFLYFYAREGGSLERDGKEMGFFQDTSTLKSQQARANQNFSNFDTHTEKSIKKSEDNKRKVRVDRILYSSGKEFYFRKLNEGFLGKVDRIVEQVREPEKAEKLKERANEIGELLNNEKFNENYREYLATLSEEEILQLDDLLNSEINQRFVEAQESSVGEAYNGKLSKALTNVKESIKVDRDRLELYKKLVLAEISQSQQDYYGQLRAKIGLISSEHTGENNKLPTRFGDVKLLNMQRLHYNLLYENFSNEDLEQLVKFRNNKVIRSHNEGFYNFLLKNKGL